jgi:hypothetical protein
MIVFLSPATRVAYAAQRLQTLGRLTHLLRGELFLREVAPDTLRADRWAPYGYAGSAA